MKKVVSFGMVLILLLAFCGCGRARQKGSNDYDMSFTKEEKQSPYSFASTDDNGEKVSLSGNSVEEIKQFIDSVKVTFAYEELYDSEENFERILYVTDKIKSHALSALDENGELTAEHLVELIKHNNSEMFEKEPDKVTFYKEISDEDLHSICELIVTTVKVQLERNPDIDKERIYCNLANLKAFYKAGMLDNAQVTSDMILHISETMFQIVALRNGDTACRDVIIHEVMHMMQMGCSCEKVPHCTRHCGITYRWDDVKQNTGDFAWLFEGSAESCMMLLTGDEPITYQNMINYIQSLNLATVLNEEIPAHYIESICFFQDPNILFDLFECETREEYLEIINLMYAINIMQMNPDDFLEEYSQVYGKDITKQEVLDEINYNLKPGICNVMTKIFYSNLAEALNSGKEISWKDVCFLMALFESAMEYHSRYTDESRITYNESFIATYKQIQDYFFEMIEKDNPTISVRNSYETYKVLVAEKENLIDANFNWLENDKKEFLLTRVAFLEEAMDTRVGR